MKEDDEESNDNDDDESNVDSNVDDVEVKRTVVAGSVVAVTILTFYWSRHVNKR